MRLPIRRMLVAALLALPAAVPARAQDAPTALAAQCALRPNAGDPFLIEVSRARDLGTQQAVDSALGALEPEARRTSVESPGDAGAQYRLAAVLGARLDWEHGTSKMKGAEQVLDQAERVLTLDPAHPGASYMVGRIHSSVMRMSGLKRFMAKALFGSRALEGASWERAQDLLEVAVREDPCVPDHHYELARLYAERGNPAGAEQELAHVRDLTEGAVGRVAKLREKADALEKDLRL